MMDLSVGEVVAAVGGTLLAGSATQRLRGVTIDSRRVPPGGLFVPLPGSRVDACHGFGLVLIRLTIEYAHRHSTNRRTPSKHVIFSVVQSLVSASFCVASVCYTDQRYAQNNRF